MACGTPVISSNAASLPEVAGDAAAYFDPANAEELAEQIERVVNDKELRGAMREKGLQRAKKFSWQEFTRKHLELYHQVLGLN